MKERVSATIDKETSKIIDEMLKKGNYRNKSHVIEDAIKILKEVKNGKQNK
ncbi:ribbon-helix-helix protein, CopG family [Candidatus Pacearchaeota archaeon]|nr:ribbon-helix-helix protein, CopG family [Candidatus Pacearchaeota archaeon]